MRNLNDWHLSPTKESGDGVNFETVMLIVMYLAVTRVIKGSRGLMRKWPLYLSGDETG